MTDSKYLDKEGKLIQRGDVRINSEGFHFIILDDLQGDMHILVEDLRIGKLESCKLVNTSLVDRYQGSKRQIFLKFLKDMFIKK